MGGGIVGPARAAALVGVGDVGGRGQVAGQFLHAREGEGIVQRRESGRRKALRHEGQQGGGLGQHALGRGQCGHAALGVHAQVVRALLLPGGDVQFDQIELGAGFVQGDVGGQGASAGSGVEGPA